jgi:selenoprotein W-related protein
VKEATGIKPELIRSGGGVFEIAVDGELLYSKKATGAFPEDEDIVRRILAKKSKE